MKDPSGLRVSSFKAWSRPEYISMQASLAARDFFLEPISTRPVHSPAIFFRVSKTCVTIFWVGSSKL